MRCTVALAVSCLMIASLSAAEHAAASVRQEARIPAQSLSTALETFARSRSLQLVYATDEVGGLQSSGAAGNLTAGEALTQLLQGTGLSHQFLDDKTITVKPSAASKARLSGGATSPLRGTENEGAAQREAEKETAHVTAAESQSLWPRLRLAMAQGENQGSDASASAASENKLAEITVTARRREESQQDVPLSIMAISGERLTESRVDDLSQLERLVPGMIYGGMSITATPSIFLRGIGSLSQSTAVDPSVGIAIDGVVSARSSALAGEFNDIERVEVLRGPQGTLFGRNTSAGLVSIVTKDPSESWSGNMEVGTGSYDEVRVRGGVSGPLAGDELLGRISFLGMRRGGYLTNEATRQKILDDSQLGLRGTFVYRPVDEARFRLSLYGLDRDNNWAHSLVPPRSFGPLSSAAELSNSDIAGPSNTSVRTFGSGGISYHTETWGATLQWDQQLGDHTLTSITAYQDWSWAQKWGNLYDTPPAPNQFLNRVRNDSHAGTSQWSQELRFASPADQRIEYVAGLYYYYLKFDNFLDQLFQVSPTVFLYNNSTDSNTTNSFAGFGEANFHATDTITLIAGARWTHESKDYFRLGLVPPPGTIGFLVSTQPGTTVDEATDERWSWRLGARWQPTEDHMLYATAARGSKGPGFNNLSTLLGVSQEVRPEVATTYEIGAKSSWLDHRLSSNLALYYSQFEDLQAQSLATLVTPSGVTVANFFLTNAGKAESQGVELELQAVPMEGLTLSVAGAYIDGIYKEYLGAQCYPGQAQFATGCVGFNPANFAGGSQDLSGTRLPLAPEWSGTFGAHYAMKFQRFDGFIQADYSRRSEVQYSQANAPNTIEDGYGLLGATIGVSDKEGRYTFTVYGKNLTDEFHVTGLGFIGGGFGTTTMQIGPDYQRIWGATFNYNF